MGIRYIPGRGTGGYNIMELAKQINAQKDPGWSVKARTGTSAVRGVDCHTLFSSTDSNSAPRSWLELMANQYLYPHIPSDAPERVGISNRSTDSLRAELMELGIEKSELPENHDHLGSLYYQLTVDRELRKPQVGQIDGTFSFFAEDPLILDLLSILFSGKEAPSFWAGKEDGAFIYSGRDLCEELIEMAEGIRLGVAEDLRRLKPTITALKKFGNLSRLEAFPAYLSEENDHPYGYRVSYTPSDQSMPVLLNSLLTRTELFELAGGDEIDGSGQRLELKGIDFSHRLI